MGQLLQWGGEDDGELDAGDLLGELLVTSCPTCGRPVVIAGASDADAPERCEVCRAEASRTGD